MAAAAPSASATYPVVMTDKFKVYFLCVDPVAGTVTRYLHRRGCYGVMKLQHAVMESREVIDQWGAEESRKLLEEFRLKGEVKGET